MIHALSLFTMLFLLWLGLSGFWGKPLLLGLGIASSMLVVALALRIDTLDREGHPIHITWKAPHYWLWLAWQMALSNADVVRRILSPRLAISPTIVRVRPSQSDALGRVVYANWITLTPGTLSIDVQEDAILVHALSKEGAEALADGSMDHKVSRLMGDR